MAFFGKRPQQYRLGWPWNAAQVENADSMFETLFNRIGQLERLLNTKIAGVATTAGVTNASPTLSSAFDYANDEPYLLPVPGATGPQGPPGPPQMALFSTEEADPALLATLPQLPEVGTWTPVMVFGAGSTGITYSTQSGIYTKIGNLVHVTFRVTLTSKGSSTGTAAITGLPYAPSTVCSALFGFFNGMTGLTGALASFTSGSALVLCQQGGSSSPVITDTSFTNTADLVCSMTYAI